MSQYLKTWRVVLVLIFLMGLSFVFGLAYGQKATALKSSMTVLDSNIINNTNAAGVSAIDMEPFWKVWNLLDTKYVTTVGAEVSASTTNQHKIWGAIQGLTESLGDPYTVFLPPADAKEFNGDISGNFEGVGMEIGIKEGVLSVVSPLKGSPAEKAGLKAGDKILTIDGQPATDLSTDQAVKLIRGPKDTVVNIGILRNGDSKTLNFVITRSVINVPSLETEIIDDVFIIKLYNFYAPARTQFNGALKEFINSKKHRLIIDLRGNPGGYLDAAVDIASWFLPLGKVVVREDFGPGKPETVYRSRGYDIFTDKLQLVILIDGGSASASEILAGALQEHGLAKLVGTKTYGKGSVQELVHITSDPATSLKVTVAKWLTPNGKSISENGLQPDFEVKISEADIKADKDPQMDQALEILK